MLLLRAVRKFNVNCMELYSASRRALVEAGFKPVKLEEPLHMVFKINAFTEAYIILESLNNSTRASIELRMNRGNVLALLVATLTPFMIAALISSSLKMQMLMVIAAPLTLLLIAIPLQLLTSKSLAKFMKTLNDTTSRYRREDEEIYVPRIIQRKR